MRLNKIVLVFSMSVAIMSGCSSTDEKDGSLLEGEQNGASTSGYSDGSSVSGEQFGSNGVGGNGLGPEFSDPTNPLSKQTIYFMYDSSQVQQDFIQVIAAHAQYIMSNPSGHIILEGHADERGSREYNIALGEQRAKSVFRMMKMQGVADSQLEIVSYGEEKPASDGMDEASWQLNRRVEIVYQGQ
jgi:peptidoglycan-associated lipoprotein